MTTHNIAKKLHVQEDNVASSLKAKLGDEWYEVLKDEFDKDYMINLGRFVKERRSVKMVYPEPDFVFNAYKSTPLSKIKVVIVGQDCYINPYEAHGLSFSTYSGKSTPSLRKIEKAITEQVYKGNNPGWNNNLERWASQGVLLLNAVLTVDAGKSNSHANQGWEIFTGKTIKEISNKGSIVFLLWGKYAQNLEKYIDLSTNIVLKAEHPVFASYQNRDWDNKDCFNRVNEILEDQAIIW